MDFNSTNPIYTRELSDINQLEFIPWNRLSGKSILVTGATGLICSCLIDVLMFRNMHYNSNITLHAMGRNAGTAKIRFRNYLESRYFNFIEHNVTAPLEHPITVDYIIHGASPASPAVYVKDPVGTMKANIWGVYHLLEWGRSNGCKRFLYISSGEVYGEIDKDSFDETDSGYVDCIHPRACYPSGKRAAETLCISFMQQYNMDVVIGRPCHIYGPTLTSSDNRAFAQFIRNALSETPIVLKSKGAQVRSYCYVTDCISALLLLLLKGEKGGAYNIGNRDNEVSIAEFAETVAQVGGQQVKYELPEEEEKKGYSLIPRAVLNPEKLEKLGWKAQYSLSESLKHMINILSTSKN